MTYERLTPWQWPQDDVQIPTGYGVMPRIEHANRTIVQQEATIYTGELTIPALTPAGRIFQITIPTDEDGDFWCNCIAVMGMHQDAPGGDFASLLPVSNIGLQDLRTQNILTYPSRAPTYLFQRSGTLDNVGAFSGIAGLVPFPSGFRPLGTLIQPICFTRSGGIMVTLEMVAATIAGSVYEVSFCFSGWKEYTYAST